MTGYGERRGVALVLVLWLIVILGGIGAAVVTSARAGLDTTASVRARTIARYAAESGVVAGARALEQRMDAAGDDMSRRHALLNDATRALGSAAAFSMGDAEVRVVMIDASARIDINTAPEEVLSALFARAGHALVAVEAARSIRRHIEAVPGRAQLLRSLDEASSLDGVGRAVMADAARWLTVDGDGQVNRGSADRVVLSVAKGSLVDEPTRIVLVARGWQRGHPLTHEIQAVYAVQGNQLAFVSWRERDL